MPTTTDHMTMDQYMVFPLEIMSQGFQSENIFSCFKNTEKKKKIWSGLSFKDQTQKATIQIHGVITLKTIKTKHGQLTTFILTGMSL